MTDIKKIHAALHEPFEANGSLLHMGVRIGVAFLNDDSINAITLVQQAEQAMFKVKKQGGNTIIAQYQRVVFMPLIKAKKDRYENVY